MERAVCLIVGYVFGLFQTGYLYSRLQNKDLRNYGSHNSGATNALRVMGVKAGIIVFFGDALKTIFACVFIWLLFRQRPGMLYVYYLYTGLGVILGHDFPFYMDFKGGKGIAATAGLFAVIDIRIAAVCLAVFILTVALTRYVSVGSILILIVFAVLAILFARHGDYGIARERLPEFYVLTLIISGLGIARHHANIGRLLNGTENRFSMTKGK